MLRTSIRLALCAFLLVPTLQAGNLLQNPDFNQDLNGWTSDVVASWSNIDSEGVASSGSAHVVNSNLGGMESGLQQCVAVTGGTTYELATRILAPSTNVIKPGAAIGARAYFYSSTNCASGTLVSVGTGSAMTPKDEWVQAVDFEPAPSSARSAQVHLIVATASGGPALNATFDHAFFGPGTPDTPGAQETQYLSTVGSVRGANSSFFHSDVWITNLSYENYGFVTLAYHCFAGQTCNTTPTRVNLAPRQSRPFRDIVGDFLGSPQTSGGLEITYDPYVTPAAVMEHLYTPSDQPTFGFSLMGRLRSDARTRTNFPGIAGGGPITSGFRSNVGFYNPNDTTANVTVRIYTALGVLVGTPVTRSLGGHTGTQINGVYAEAGGTSATLIGDLTAVVTSDVPIFSFASRVDNVSNDPALSEGTREFAPQY